MLGVVFGSIADDFFSLLRRFNRCSKRRIFRQPDGDIREVCKILREILHLELAGQESAKRKNGCGSCQHLPAMRYRKVPHSIVQSWKTFSPPLFDRWLRL